MSANLKIKLSRGAKGFLFLLVCVIGGVPRGDCALTSVDIMVNKLPADFYTGKMLQPNDLTINVHTDDAGSGNGLESGMRVSIALVSSLGTTPISNGLSVSNLNFVTSTISSSPVFQCLQPFTGNSVRFQVTISSMDGTILTPAAGINPAYSSAINIYDFVQGDVQIVQAPDPSHAKFTVGTDVNPVGGPYGVNVIIHSTESSAGFGPENYMRVKVEMIDFNGSKISSGVLQENLVPGTDFSLGSSTNHVTITPLFASYSETLRYRVTISSANGQLLVPQNGVNPSTTSVYFSVNAGPATKFILLPNNAALIRPSLLGRAAYSISSPFQWQPTALGETLRVKAFLTDAWSNPVDAPNTQLVFGATQYLTLPAYNFGATWILDGGIQGTEFTMDINAWLTPVPITVTSPDGYAAESIYIEKIGIPGDTIYAGPSPFNPKTGTITFGFHVNENRSMKILVLDLFGQEVWEKTVDAVANLMTMTSWDGTNNKGQMVAAGVYWVVLERDGHWESKKKFGVIK